MTLGQKLRMLLKENNMTQEELAEELDISRQAVGKWVNDRGKPEIEKLDQISAIFSVTLDYLVKDKPEDQGEDSGYYVSGATIDSYLSHRRRAAKHIAIGISLLILSNAFPSMGMDRQASLIIYWISMALGVAVLAWHFLQPKRYKHINSRVLVFDAQVIKNFRTESDSSRKKQTACMIAGIILFILTPQIGSIIKNYYGSNARNALIWVLYAVCAALMMIAGISMRAEFVIARNSDYVKKIEKRGSTAWMAFALPILGIAFLIGCFTNAWSPIIPVVALVCLVMMLIIKMVLERRGEQDEQDR